MGRIERLAPLGGVLAAVLWAAAVFVLETAGNPADPDAAQQIVEHFRENRTAINVAGLLSALGAFVFFWFLASLYRALRAGDPGGTLSLTVAVAGTAAATAMLLLFGPQTTGATTDTELLDPGAAVGFWRLAHGFFIAAEVAFAAMVAAVSLLALRGVLLPRWLGWAGLVLALLLLIVPIGWAALLLLLPLWLVAVSLMLFRRRQATPPL